MTMTSKYPVCEKRAVKTQIGCLILLVGHRFLPTARGSDLSLQQQLIVACYRLDASKVARCLRDGANVNAVFGQSPGESPFFDRWDGGQ
jgi:hypothetical protein